MPSSPDELTDEIQRLADELDQTPRQKDIQNHSDYPLSRFRTVFGSWNNAVEAAGFKSYSQRRRISESELVDEMNRLCDEIDKPPSADEMSAYGEYSHAVYIDRFGSWRDALQEAGITPIEPPTGPTRDELIDELKDLSEQLGRIPSSKDVDNESEYSYSTYYRVFDGFTEALKEAELL